MRFFANCDSNQNRIKSEAFCTPQVKLWLRVSVFGCDFECKQLCDQPNWRDCIAAMSTNITSWSICPDCSQIALPSKNATSCSFWFFLTSWAVRPITPKGDIWWHNSSKTGILQDWLPLNGLAKTWTRIPKIAATRSEFTVRRFCGTQRVDKYMETVLPWAEKCDACHSVRVHIN